MTAGHGADELAKQFEADLDDYNSIMTKALADRLAEAFAEFLHERARLAWRYGKQEHLSKEDLLREAYRGIRPAAGYPACPDHTEKQILFDLARGRRKRKHPIDGKLRDVAWCIGERSLFRPSGGQVFWSREKSNKDQVLDYQQRKGMPLEEVERWLGPYLNYEPVRTVLVR